MTSVEDGEVGLAVQSPAVKVEHFSLGEREARGKAARADVPRSAHAGWEPPPLRPRPVELLEEQAATRVPELVPIRYGRMLVSPFTFYRGAAYLMASDLAGMPRTGLHTQLCGDAHLSNFGAFAAPDRRLVFSINDFDETLPGPFEWDVKRLVGELRGRGPRPRLRRQGAGVDQPRGRTRLTASRSRVRRDGQSRSLVRANGRRRRRPLRSRKRREGASSAYERNLAKTRAKDSLKALAKLTEIVEGELRIVSDPPVVVPIEEVAGERAHEFEDFLRNVIRAYRRTLPGDRRKLLERYRYVHAARKVVGVGSVGTRAYIMLMLGRDDGDPLFLQFKEAEASVLEPFLGKSEYANHGQRVVEGQRLTQAASDIMLGWIRAEGDRQGQARLLRAPAVGREGIGADRADGARRCSPATRGSAAPSSPVPMRDRATRIAIASYLGTQRHVRPRAGRVRRGLRRPERTRLQDAHRRSRGRHDHGRNRSLGPAPVSGGSRVVREPSSEGS